MIFHRVTLITVLRIPRMVCQTSLTFRALLFCPTVMLFLLVFSTKGQSQVIAPSHPTVGNNIIWPKHPNPAMPPVFLSLEWSGPDLTDASLKRSRVEVSEDGSYRSYNNSNASLLLLLVSRVALTFM